MSGKEKPIASPINREEAEPLSLGNITISDEVVATIAAQAARKIKGVLVVGSSFRLSEILGAREPSYKGVSIKADQETGHVDIDLDVNVLYGVNIYETVERLQRQIINDVESLTGSMIAERVNVRVKSIVMPEMEEEEALTPDKAMAKGLTAERARHEKEQ